jgi:hypothetical protein
MILGLDASTATVGISILDMNGNVVLRDYAHLKKLKGICQKADYLEDKLLNIRDEYDIKHVFIEDYAKKMKRGQSSAQTITLLASWNGVVQVMCYKLFSMEPELLEVTRARKACGIPLLSKKKSGGVDAKTQVFEWVSKNVKGMENPPTKVLQSGPRKGLEVFIDQASDMTDAWVIAYAGFQSVKP